MSQASTAPESLQNALERMVAWGYKDIFHAGHLCHQRWLEARSTPHGRSWHNDPEYTIHHVHDELPWCQLCERDLTRFVDQAYLERTVSESVLMLHSSAGL